MPKTKQSDIKDKIEDVEDTANDLTQQVLESQDESSKTEVDLDAIQSELEQARKDNENLRNELKNQTQAAQKHSKDSQKWQSEVSTINSRIDSVTARFDALAEAIEEAISIRDTTETYEERNPQRRTSYKEKLQALEKDKPDSSHIALQAHQKEVANEIINLLQPHQIEFDKSKEFREAYNEWRFGNFDEALVLVKEKVQEMEIKKSDEKEAKLESDEEKFERMYQERRKKEMIEKGELNPETGLPTGGAKQGRVPTLEELQESDPMETKKKVESGEWVLDRW